MNVRVFNCFYLCLRVFTCVLLVLTCVCVCLLVLAFALPSLSFPFFSVLFRSFPFFCCRYELHVSKGHQGSGLGSALLREVETIARQNSHRCEKLMLTAFKALPRSRVYRTPLPFYHRHGYRPDPISPSQCLSPKEAALYDYEILSKAVERE